jgi:sulfur carrier protein
MKVLLRNPRRELEIAGPITVTALLQRLDLSPEAVLVIAGDELVARDARLDDATSVEIRPVISGGDRPTS